MRIPPPTSGRRHARGAFLDWTAKDLAQKAKVGVSTVQRIENTGGTPNVHPPNMAAIQSALEPADIKINLGT
jgi:hypothetical protein